ncbi:AlbA family DNA-binding domain-containing protein [Candidatus Avelusimicrobium alvi]|uniref:AlbA family DNA-binding domain-containing protein n=1 Tax=Candidatus Avelusimicrobium alvi TaxID=3416221 RepID=UPI003D1511CF
MLFDKPIHDLTFHDVAAFCRRQLPEGKQLDYKYMLPKNHEKFAKTIASFANAMGGTIIVGVQDDKNDKPRPPFLGIPYHEKVRNSIEDIIQVYIDPIVFVDINICVNDRGDRMFIVINIPQSNLTPHLVGKSKRAYIRTGQSSRPEAIVHPEKLPWLLDHRKKSERLRHILYDKAESHFDNYLKTMNVSADGETVCTMSVMPLYPEEPLTDYKHLPELIKASSARAPYGVMADPEFPLQPVQDGAAVISNKRGFYRMTEFNSYGLVMNKQIVSQEEIVNGHTAKTIRIERLAQNLTLFLLSARKFLNRLSFGGPLYFRFKMNNTRALRALLGAKQATVLEDYLRLDRSLALCDLQARLPEMLEDILHEAAWSLGVQTDAQEMKTLLKSYLDEAH